MKIVWDEPKLLANLEKHGLDFADLNETFFETALVRTSYRNRWFAIGPDAHGIIAVVFVTLGQEGLQCGQHAPCQQERKETLCRKIKR